MFFEAGHGVLDGVGRNRLRVDGEVLVDQRLGKPLELSVELISRNRGALEQFEEVEAYSPVALDHWPHQ